MIKTIDTAVATKAMIELFENHYGSSRLSFFNTILAILEAAPAVEPAQAEQSEESGDLMWATATMRDRERNRIGKIVDGLEQIKQEKLTAIKAADDEPAQAVPEGYRLQSIAELDAMNEWIYSNDDLTIAYMSGRNDQKAIDHYNKQKALDFVRWIAQLKTGGLIQARANDILRILEKWK